MVEGWQKAEAEQGATSARVGSQLLRVKTTRPQGGAGLVERPQLVTLLNSGLDRRVTMVCAPGGYGKTTAVAQWLERVDRPNAWLSLDPLDNDLGTFVAYFLAATRSVYPEAGSLTAPLLASAPDVPPEVFADALIEDLATLDGPLVLALDDFHLIEDSRVFRLLERLLQFVPSNIHLVFISRADPALPLARLRLRGEVADVQTNDLRFGPDTAGQFLTNLTGVEFDDASAATLDARTEGWVLALQLAGLIMRQGESPAELAQRFGRTADPHVTAYLMEEVFSRQPAATRDFLLRTSILERLSVPLCAAVAQEPRAAEILHQLLQSNQMIVPLDEGRQWFRYHPLFQQFLYDRLLETEPEAAVAELHQRAAVRFGSEGFITDAISHAVAAGDPEMALGLIEDNLHPLLNREDWSQLTHWLELLPATARSHPSMLVARGWLHIFHLQPGALAQTMAAAAAAMVTTDLPPVRRDRLQTQIDILSGVVAYWAFDNDRALALLETSLPRLTPEMAYVRGQASLYFGLALHISGRSVEALHFFQSEIGGQMEAADWLATRLLMGQIMIYGDLDDLQASLPISEYLIQVGLRSSIWNSYGWGLYASGQILYELNRLPEAEALLRRVLDLPHQFGATTVYLAYLLQALTVEALGRPGEADEILRRGREFALLRTSGVMLLPYFAAAENLLSLYRGHTVELSPARAPTLAEAIPDVRQPQYVSVVQTRAAYLIQLGTPESLREARTCLAVLYEAANRLRAWRQQAGITALDAVAMAAQGDEAGALVRLRQSLGRARSGQSIRRYVDCGPALIPLLQQLAAADDAPPMSGPILRACEAQWRPGGAAPDGPSAGPFPGAALQLTNREYEVLCLMAERLSDKQIASRLFLTPGTVRQYTPRLYAKLGVSNRREAIAAAERLGLLPPR